MIKDTVNTSLLKYLCSLPPISSLLLCFSLQMIGLLLWNRKQPFVVVVVVLFLLLVAWPFPKLMQILQSLRASMAGHSVPIPHFFVHKELNFSNVQTYKLIFSFYVPSHLHSSIWYPNQKLLKDHNKGCFPGSFLLTGSGKHDSFHRAHLTAFFSPNSTQPRDS